MKQGALQAARMIIQRPVGDAGLQAKKTARPAKGTPFVLAARKEAQTVAVSASSNTSLTFSSSSRSMVTLPPFTRRPKSSSSASAERIVS